MKPQAKFSSRKFLLTMLTVAITILNSRLELLSETELEYVIASVAFYVGLEGAADILRVSVKPKI